MHYMAPHGAIWRYGAGSWGHVGPCGAIWCHNHDSIWAISTIRVRMGTCDAIWAQMLPTCGHIRITGPYCAIWANMCPYVTRRRHMNPCGAILSHMVPYCVIWGHVGQYCLNVCIYLSLYIYILTGTNEYIHPNPLTYTGTYSCIRTYICTLIHTSIHMHICSMVTSCAIWRHVVQY